MSDVRVGAAVGGAAALLLLTTAASCGDFGSTAESDAGTDASAQNAPDAAGPDAASPSADAASPDAGADADAAADAAKAPCDGEAACPRFVFVSSELFAGEDMGGAIGADGRCTARGAMAGITPALAGRKWMAWVSDDIVNLSATARMTHGTMPYRLGSGALIANDWQQLTSGALLHAIDQDEYGLTVGQESVWTGTGPFGQVTPTNCTNWSIAGAMNTGTVGLASASDSSWTNSGATPCGTGHRLYCIEK